MTKKLNENIKFVEKEIKKHSKASEEYVHVEFNYPQIDEKLDIWIPIEYRRTGVSISTKEELIEYLNNVYEQIYPKNKEKWLNEQKEFWDEKSKAKVTKEFFDSLSKGGWQCVECTLPKNPNWARRIQDLKEFGYTIATDTNRFCSKCNSKKTHLIMLPIKRCGINGNGYETWSPKLRNRIINVLKGIDVYEDTKNSNCLPDHKFSEIRWDENTKSINKDDMSNEEIKEKFQLLTNQRNQQKREICRNCYQTGKRGTIFGIEYFYKGTDKWDESIPKRGKEAEKGCIGCPWYDIERWRRELIKKINNKENK